MGHLSLSCSLFAFRAQLLSFCLSAKEFGDEILSLLAEAFHSCSSTIMLQCVLKGLNGPKKSILFLGNEKAWIMSWGIT